jgi:hypothetical protein
MNNLEFQKFLNGTPAIDFMNRKIVFREWAKGEFDSVSITDTDNRNWSLNYIIDECKLKALYEYQWLIKDKKTSRHNVTGYYLDKEEMLEFLDESRFDVICCLNNSKRPKK